MNIRRISVENIRPAQYNPRKALRPGDAEFERLARSVDEFGLVEPLVWNERTGNLVGGHQRFAVLMARGARNVEVSVVDLPLEREKLLNIALNKIVGEWDDTKLAALLEELIAAPDVDVALTGFELPEAESVIAAVLASGSADQQERFDVQAELERHRGRAPVTKPGDLILLGRDPRLQHRLLCGDCTDAALVRRVMDGARAALFATDPPYLVNYTGVNHPSKRRGANKDWSGTYGAIEGSWDDPKRNAELYTKFVGVAVREAIRPNAAWYCWHASRNQTMVEAAWAAVGARVHQQVIWVKSRGVLTRSLFLWRHEPCAVGWIEGKKPIRTSAPMLSTVWEVPSLPNTDERPDHPTPKPLELFEIPIQQHTRPGEVLYEPFAGSGTQFIAAQRLGRRCFGLEISPVYCDLIIRRFIAFAGEHAVAPAIAKRFRNTERGAA